MITEPKKETITDTTTEITQTVTHATAYTEHEQKIIEGWSSKKQTSVFQYEVDKTQTAANKTTITSKFTNQDLSAKEKRALAEAILFKISGTSSEKFAILSLANVLTGVIPDVENIDDVADKMTAIQQVLLELNPTDPFEGMIVSQMIVLNHQAMDYMARALHAEYAKNQDRYINNATKLMRLWNEKLESLNKHRRKGEQRVVVQHVNVNDGGQAIVGGSINQGGGDHIKK